MEVTRTIITTFLFSLLLHAARLEVSNSQLSLVMQTLWNVDSNRFDIGQDIRLNLQGRASSYNDIDQAPSRLFSTVPNLSKKSTYKKFISLLDNYNPFTHKHDQANNAEREEQKTFINSILGTRVWHEARQFLIKQGFVKSSTDLSNELHRIWFTEYSRAKGVIGTSGFEHVFVGEINDGKKETSGLHNWIIAYQLESSKSLNYQGYIQTSTNNNLYEIKLRLKNYGKSGYGNSMFIGTSPEFEMAVYTVCFLARNGECNFTMNRKPVTIQTYTSYNNVLATAFPKI